jgi:hypothetical protein
LKGLCHVCFRSGIELIILKGKILCSDCLNQNDAKN